MSEHSQECLSYQDELIATINAYTEKWPHFCGSCAGWGFTGGSSGSYFDPPDEPDPCEDCIDQNKCPRCAHIYQTWDDEKCEFVSCPSCKWDPANPDGVPVVDPCYGCLEDADPWDEIDDTIEGRLLSLAESRPTREITLLDLNDIAATCDVTLGFVMSELTSMLNDKFTMTFTDKETGLDVRSEEVISMLNSDAPDSILEEYGNGNRIKVSWRLE